jgi:hypothetical protein
MVQKLIALMACEHYDESSQNLRLEESIIRLHSYITQLLCAVGLTLVAVEKRGLGSTITIARPQDRILHL